MKRNRKIIDRILDTVSNHSNEWIPVNALKSEAMPNQDALMTRAQGILTTDASFEAHVKLCIESGWLETQSNPHGAEQSPVVRLTWAGHNAVEAGSGRWA